MRAEPGIGGAGGVVVLLGAVGLLSISVSAATLMSSMSGADLRLSIWIRERRVAFSWSVAAAAVGMVEQRADGVAGVVDAAGAFSLFLTRSPFSVM